MLDDAQFEELAKANRCYSILDLTGSNARRLVWHTTRKFLEGHKVCVLELLHHAPTQKAFIESSGMLANTIQKVAIMQVKGLSEGVQERVKFLNGLSDQLVKKTWEAHKDKKIPTLKPDAPDVGLTTALALTDKEQSAFLVYSAFANYLNGHKDAAAKITALADLLPKTANPDLHGYIFRLMSDVLHLDSLWGQMFQGIENLTASDRLWMMIDLIDNAPFRHPAPPALLTLFKNILPQDSALECRRVFGDMLTTMYQSSKILKSKDLIEELRVAHELFCYVSAPNRGHFGERTIKEAERKITRLFDYESIQTYLREQPSEFHRMVSVLKLYPMAFGAKDREALNTLLKNAADRVNTKDSLKVQMSTCADVVTTVTTLMGMLKDAPKDTPPEEIKNKIREKIKAVVSA